MKLRNGKSYSKNIFKKWLNKTEKLIYKKTNFEREDLPDEDYWKYWDLGFTPMQMADIVNNNLIASIKSLY